MVGGTFRKRGWIQNNEIVLLRAALLEPFENIGLDQSMSAVFVNSRVERKVSARAFQGVCADVDIRHSSRSAAGGVKGKTTGKTESVQHVFACRKATDDATILPLIEEKARLLAFENIRFELQTRFKKDDWFLWRGANQNGWILNPEMRRSRLNVAAQTQDEALGTEFVVKQGDDLIETREPDAGIKLQNECLGELIEDEPGKLVAFAIDPAGGVRFQIENPGTALARRLETFTPPFLVHLRRFATMNDANPNGRSGIEKTQGQEFVLPVKNDREFAGGSAAALLADTVREDPGMTGANERFSSRAKADVKALNFQAGSWTRRIEWPGGCR